MEELYKDAPNLPMDVTNSPSAMANNKLENGVAQLITAEAWNINSADLMKKALSPLVTVPAPSILTPPAESQSGVALKVAATVLQPICLGDSPVVLPIHLQVAGSAAPQMPATNAATPYVMTTQGPVPLPVLLEQHVFQHLNSPLVLPPGAACPASPLHAGLFPGSATPVGQPQLLDPKPSGQAQEPVLPPVFQTPGFAAVLQDLFPSQGALGSAPCQPPPDYATLPPQAFSSPLSPLVPPATLLVPYPVIVPLPVPIPIPIPVPIPVPHGAEAKAAPAKAAPDPPKPPLFTPHSCKGTQTPLEKEETKPFELLHPREFPQLSRHTVIKMGGENEALDLSMKAPPALRAAPGRAGCEPKAGNNIEIVSTSQTAKVIVSVKDAVPTIFCGKIKGLSGVSTNNFSFKRDLPQDSVLQCYDVKSPPEPRDSAEALRKPVKNRSVKLKKMNSPEIHILPIKKQRLAAFFPRK
ncbi:PREDICTED: LOW QUALITY PROTEIN: retinoic acid-induced protein 2 [Ficedula albicollis]|uniref:LOW QUALITY PROTEIN: retinoic acid-induced protein 2 n=1 Tax=Ficedula albicollis TaxID=59894 RepID=UPI0007AD9396|nr:PREDICTED: LOW QUALITY PROTEIN: retinoic acid-induced protein 2 [Ficedula albicollis]